MVLNDKEMILSYVLSIAKYNFSAYEQRILNCLVYIAQQIIEGKQLHKDFSIQPALLDNLHIINCPLSIFAKNEDDRNTEEIKKALRSLRNKTIEYQYHPNPNSKHYIWKLIGIIELPKFDTRGRVEFKVHQEIYEAIFHFAKGYRKIEFAKMMSFESTYAMRLYEIISTEQKLHPYKIDTLRAMFKLENKYKQNKDFFTYVIDTAKKELDAHSPYTFTYKRLAGDGRTEVTKRGQKIEYIKFYPVYQDKHASKKLEETKLKKQVSLRFDLDVVVLNYLRENFAFSDEGIKNNLDLFKDCQKNLPDFILSLSKLKVKADAGSKAQGWVINALKKQLKDLEPVEKKAPIKRGKQAVSSIAKVTDDVDVMGVLRDITNKKTVI